MSSRSIFCTCFGVVGLLTTPFVAQAQEAVETRRDQFQVEPSQRQSLPPAADTSRETSANQELVHYLAAKLLIANRTEVELGDMARQQTQNPQVEQLADRIVEDHKQLSEKLIQQMPALAGVVKMRHELNQEESGLEAHSQDLRERAAVRRSGEFQEPIDTEPSIENLGDRDRAFSTNEPRHDEHRLAASSKPLDGPAHDLLKITERAAETHLQMTKQMLGNYRGQDFDMAFLGHQIASHMWLVAELRAIQDIGPQELQSVAGQAEKTTQEHLDKAKQLAQRLEDDRRTAQQPNRIDLRTE